MGAGSSPDRLCRDEQFFCFKPQNIPERLPEEDWPLTGINLDNNSDKKRRRSLRIFSAHITRYAMEIDVFAPFAIRAIISLRAYFHFSDPKTPYTS